MDAFDSDVLIYAAVPGHELGTPIRALFEVDLKDEEAFAGIGSVLLLPELLAKPLRDGAQNELLELSLLLARIHLIPTDLATAELATALAESYRLRAADSVHLATAVGVGADRFITNNRKDFPKSITEISVIYPEELGPR